MFELGTLALIVLFAAIVLIAQGIEIVPQQHAWILGQLGKYRATLSLGLNIMLPFVDRVACKYVLKEIPPDVPSQICITENNTQLQVDGILCFQITDPIRISYGSSNFVIVITRLAQTTLRSIIGKLEPDKTFEERNFINHSVVSALGEAASNRGVKVLHYKIKDLTPPKEILHVIQVQITAGHEEHALIAASGGKRQEQVNLASGARGAAIQRSEGEEQAAINRIQGEVAAILAAAEVNAQAIQKIGQAVHTEGGIDTVNLKVAEEYVSIFGNLVEQDNTFIVPGSMGDLNTMIASALTIVKQQQRPGA